MDLRPNRDEDLALTITPVVRRVISARVSDKVLEDDLVQGTIERIIKASPDVHKDALVGYAVISARNAVAEYRRAKSREAAAYERSAETVLPEESAETALIAREERTALLGGLNSLNQEDRDLIFRHHVEGEDVIDLAESRGISSGALAVRLSRARAALRLNYTLAHRNVTLPTKACRSVLLALSSADTRAQARVDAADHLDRCEVCADLAPPLTQRQRGMVAGIPLLAAFEWVKANPFPSVAAGTGSAVAVGALIAMPTEVAVPPPPQPEPCSIAIAGKAVDPTVIAVPMSDGDPVAAKSANVYSTGNAPGFWIGCGNYRLWVETSQSQSEAVSGKKADVQGTVVSQSSDFADGKGMDAAAKSQLERSAYHAKAHNYRVF